MGETPKTALPPQDRAASLESFSPQASNPSLGGLGGRNHTENKQRPIVNLLYLDVISAIAFLVIAAIALSVAFGK
ncbi:hypothetical protein [Moorena producens]|uniref:hypothetical protein n=1 Tax=Moorena producens TaxID=1155739 RepID=UPI003C78084A